MNIQKAIMGGGCFWCIEAIIQNLKGVLKVESGYAGGKTEKPDYRSVCNGNTGHAEVVQVTYDADAISYDDLLKVFITSHNPTTPNEQGADKGNQYRSIIIYYDEIQKAIATNVVADLNPSFDNKIVTEIVPYTNYYPAEDYHQDYYNRNRFAGYCNAVITPKLTQLKKVYNNLIAEYEK